jgi:hypothetical protein
MSSILGTSTDDDAAGSGTVGGDSDADVIYRKAVTKLRMLLTATEAASMMGTEEEEDEEEKMMDEDGDIMRSRLPFAGSVSDLHQMPLTLLIQRESFERRRMSPGTCRPPESDGRCSTRGKEEVTGTARGTI